MSSQTLPARFVRSAIAPRTLLRAGLFLLVATGLIGLLHMPVGRNLLRKLGGCPVSPVDARSYDGGRQAALVRLRGVGTAPARPAAGFVLEQTSSADVAKWIASHRVTCIERVEGAMVQCNQPPDGLFAATDVLPGALEELAFGFNPLKQLVNLSLTRNRMDAAQAQVILQQWQAKFRGVLEKNPEITGQTDAAYLAGSPYSSTTVRFRFGDYLAEITATNFGAGNIRVAEQYLSARP